MPAFSTYRAKVVAVFLGLVILLGLVTLSDVVMRRLWNHGYLSLWRDYGPMIGIAFTILSLVWSDLDRQHQGLVSAHPLRFVATCARIVSGFFLAVSNSIPKGYYSSQTENLSALIQLRGLRWAVASSVRIILLVIDGLVASCVLFMLFLLAFAWFLIVAPGLYFINLVTGAPARLALLSSLFPGPQHNLAFTADDGQPQKPEPLRALSSRPVTFTAAVTTLLFAVLRLATV